MFNLNWVDCLIFIYPLDRIVEHSQYFIQKISQFQSNFLMSLFGSEFPLWNLFACKYPSFQGRWFTFERKIDPRCCTPITEWSRGDGDFTRMFLWDWRSYWKRKLVSSGSIIVKRGSVSYNTQRTISYTATVLRTPGYFTRIHPTLQPIYLPSTFVYQSRILSAFSRLMYLKFLKCFNSNMVAINVKRNHFCYIQQCMLHV